MCEQDKRTNNRLYLLTASVGGPLLFDLEFHVRFESLGNRYPQETDYLMGVPKEETGYHCLPKN